MNDEKIEGRRKPPTFFLVMGICIQKTMNTKIKLTCGVFSTKKTSGTAYFEFGKFFNNQRHNYPKSFAEIKKTKIEARIKSESETSFLASSDIYNKNINPENLDISTFYENIVNHEKKKSKQFPTNTPQS